jgi:hypothetical protein
MIYEREVHFSKKEIDNPFYFPKILIVRRQKSITDTENQQTMSEVIASLKAYMKGQSQTYTNLLHDKTKELKNHLASSIQ